MDKDQEIADALIGRQIDIFRFTASERQAVLRILKRMEEDLVQLLFYSGRPLTETSRADKARLLAQAQAVIEQFYAEAGGHVGEGLAGLGRFESEQTAATLAAAFASAIEPGLPPETYFKTLIRDTLIQGAPSAAWWERQAGDVSFRFANEVRQGLAAGETNAQIISRVRNGVMTVGQANANALVATSVQTVANAARFQTFQENDDVIKGYRQLSTLDGHTTLTCTAYSGSEWTKDLKPAPGFRLPFVSDKGAPTGTPRHWGCRSLISPITKTFRELGLDIPEFKPGGRSATGGPVAADTTFKQFIDRKGPAFADDLLGPGRAQLYREGKITLGQLLDQNGRPLTLEQLRAKYDH